MPVLTRVDGSPKVVVVDRNRTAATIRSGTAAVKVPAREPQAGTVQQQTKVVEVSSGGPRGPQGLPGQSGAGYDHLQPVASDTWVINHNLGFKPSVELIDAGFNEIEGSVTHPSNIQTIVTFLAPVAGSARLT